MPNKRIPPHNPLTRSSKKPRTDAGPSHAHSGGDSSQQSHSSSPGICPPRWNQFRSRPILSERGIDIAKFCGLFISDQVTAQSWEQFVKSHHPYSPQLVREFYSLMDHDKFATSGTVTVRGYRVTITADRINHYYGFHPLPKGHSNWLTSSGCSLGNNGKHHPSTMT